MWGKSRTLAPKRLKPHHMGEILEQTPRCCGNSTPVVETLPSTRRTLALPQTCQVCRWPPNGLPRIKLELNAPLERPHPPESPTRPARTNESGSRTAFPQGFLARSRLPCHRQHQRSDGYVSNIQIEKLTSKNQWVLECQLRLTPPAGHLVRQRETLLPGNTWEMTHHSIRPIDETSMGREPNTTYAIIRKQIRLTQLGLVSPLFECMT